MERNLKGNDRLNRKDVHRNQVSDASHAKAGVRHDFLLLPFILLLVVDRIMRTFTLKEQHVIQWAACKAGRFGVHGRPSPSTPRIATNAKEDSHCSGPFFRNRPQYLQRRECDSKVKRNEHLTIHT